jgi:tetratricopeptide (TPR) repeat protein
MTSENDGSIQADVALPSLSKTSEHWLKAGRRHQEEGNYAEALAAFEQAITLDANNADAYNALWNILPHLKRDEVVTYEQASQLAPHYARMLYNQGSALQELGCSEEALEAYEKALVLQPDDLIYLYSQAIMLRRLQQGAMALQVLRRVTQLPPEQAHDLARAYLDKGRAFCELGDLMQAYAAFEQVRILEPASSGNIAIRIIACQFSVAIMEQLHSYKQALALTEELLCLAPEDADCYVLRGFSLQGLKRHREALAAYEQALRLDPSNPDALEARARELHKLRRYSESLAAYESASLQTPQRTSLFVGKGYTLAKLRRHSEARAAFEQGLTLAEASIRREPERADHYVRKAAALGGLKRYKEVLAALDQVLRIDAQRISAYETKLRVLWKLRRYRTFWHTFWQAVEKELEARGYHQ